MLKSNIFSFFEDITLLVAWEKLLQRKEHISLIVDEYCCIKTLEDIIKFLFGFKIVDEKDDADDM